MKFLLWFSVYVIRGHDTRCFTHCGWQQVSVKATGVRGYRVTGGSYFRSSGQGKPFREDAIYVETCVKWEGSVADWANCTCKGTVVEVCSQVWESARRPKRLALSKQEEEWGEMDDRGSQELKLEGLWGYGNSFKFQCGQRHDLIKVINGITQVHWSVDQNGQEYKLQDQSVGGAGGHKHSLKLDLGIFAEINPLALGLLPHGWLNGKRN